MLVESVRTDVSPKKGSPDNWLNVNARSTVIGTRLQVQQTFLVLANPLKIE